MDNEVEVMRVIRIPPMGKLLVQVGRERTDSISTVSNPAAKQRLLAAIGELVAFAGGYQKLVNDGLAPPLAGVGEQQTETSLEERQAEFLRSLEAAGPASSTNDPLVTAQVEQPAPPAQAVSAGTDNSVATIATQVNTLINKHKNQNPNLSARRIELLADGSGAMMIQVDDKMYENPGQIDDKDVRLLIKVALKEWEQS